MIPDVLVGDGGRWMCKATNDKAEETCSCHLTVNGQLIKHILTSYMSLFFNMIETNILRPMSSLTKYIHYELSFGIIARESPKQKPTIFKHAKETFEGTKGTATRRPSQQKPPVFVRKPKTVRIEEGNCAKLNCQVSGTPTPSVKWSREGKEIKNGGRFRVCSSGTEHTFEIPHSLATDGGKYTCTASNLYGIERSYVTIHVDKLENHEKIPDYRSLLKSR